MSAVKVVSIVEDDPDMRMLVRALLRVDPRIIVSSEAGSIDEALVAVRDHEPDLVILDHFINGRVTGLDGAPMIKQAAPGTRILLFTSHDLTVEVTRQPAVDEYLQKGSVDQLLTTVQRLLSLDPSGLNDL